MEQYKAIQPRILAHRRRLHQIPEVGSILPKTSAYVREQLSAMGIPFRVSETDSGIIALIHGREEGRCIALRADMDALPVQEETGLAFASQHPGCMHACGHDAHTAMLLGAAELLQACREQLRGTVKLLFQANEECCQGALQMIADGALHAPKVDAIAALHVGILDPGLKPGQLGIYPGSIMASSDRFDIFLTGQGGHCSRPDQAVNPIPAAAQLVSTLQSIVSQETDVFQPRVFTITSVEGGDTYNTIPETVRIRGNIRAFHPDTQQLMVQRLREITQAVAQSLRVRAEVEVVTAAPVLENDRELARLAAEAARAFLPAEQIETVQRFLMGVEKVGNKLPDPVTLFVLLSAIVIVLSAICSAAGVSAVHPGTGDIITVTNLFSVEGLRRMIGQATSNYSGFAPFAMVLVAVIGAGAAEKSGFLAALMHKVLHGAPPKLVTLLVIFVGINANMVGDAGFVVLPPLAALIFLGIGRHPLLGMFTAFASVSAGFCANLFLGMFDVQGAGFTQTAAQMIDPDYVAAPTMNYFFMVASCLVMTVVGTFVTEKFVAPRFEGQDLGKYEYDQKDARLSDQESRGLRMACIAFVVAVLVLAAMCLGSSPILGDAETGELLVSTAPFMQGLILIISLLLFVPGSVYGFASAKYAILASIIVPMLMILNISPAMAQAIYRIGDSITNPLSPLFYYFPLVLGFARRYEKDTGMGTVMANMIPYSIAFTLAWIVLVILWCVFDLPLGPGVSVFLH